MNTINNIDTTTISTKTTVAMLKIAHRRLLRYMRDGGKTLPLKWDIRNGYISVDFVGGDYEEIILEDGHCTEKCIAVYENGVCAGAFAVESGIIFD